ncbi:MAG: ornithine carbamoyltransferase, partial [Acidobacteria bacterium]|nr:ornithine carbamoyltransferase [Acidobacteriota bacterium]
MRHILSLAEVGPDNLAKILRYALAQIEGRNGKDKPLAGKVVGIYFKGTSTRTRTAFTVGAHRLGASTIAYGPSDLQITTGETIQDTARVLSGFLDALVIRTNGTIEEMKFLAAQGKMAIINAMSDNEHPTQAIADLITIQEEFGRLNGVHILYI